MNSHDLVEQYLPIPTALKNSLIGEGNALPQFEDDGPDLLKSRRVALITSHGPELPEFHIPLQYLRDRGASVDVVTPDWLFDKKLGEALGFVMLAQFLAVNFCVKANKKISDANIEDYDAIVILGGAWNPIVLRTNELVLEFVREAHDRGKLIAAICHGPQVLISSKAFPPGTRATGVDDILIDLENAKFEVPVVKGQWVVYDEIQRLITSPGPQPESLKAFCEEIAKRL